MNSHNFTLYTTINFRQIRKPNLKNDVYKNNMGEYLTDPWMSKSSLNMKTLKKIKKENIYDFCLWKILNYTSEYKQNLECKWQAGKHICNKTDKGLILFPPEKQAKNINTHLKRETAINKKKGLWGLWWYFIFFFILFYSFQHFFSEHVLY